MRPAVAFDLPADVEAAGPPATRDGVRLLVARPDGLTHTRFDRIADQLAPGDLVVVNTSGTLAAAVDGTRDDGTPVTVHLATGLDEGSWVVEIRPAGQATGPVPDTRAGGAVTLPDGVTLRLLAAHPAGQSRLWRARLVVEGGVPAYLTRHGHPIRYGYVPRAVPLAEYQTVFARTPGSAEMPSAGRPFTDRLVTDLVTRGIAVVPITLHTGVSSQEPGEPPQPERYAVTAATARLVNAVRAAAGRVVAVGTTATRALESATDHRGLVHARRGWTELVLGPERPARVVTGLVTGWHAPGASHLGLLEAVAGTELVQRAYDAAVAGRYRWHEFGDSCLLLP